MEKLTSCDRDWRMGCARSKLIPCLNAMDETISKSRTLNGSYHHGLRAKMCLASMSLAAGGFGPSGVNKSTPPPHARRRQLHACHSFHWVVLGLWAVCHYHKLVHTDWCMASNTQAISIVVAREKKQTKQKPVNEKKPKKHRKQPLYPHPPAIINEQISKQSE